MKKMRLMGWLVAGVLGCGGAVAQAATLSGSFTADDYMQVYLSSDLVASAGELVWNKQSSWGATESFSGVALAPGQSMYLLVDALNVSGPAMFIGDFQIAGSGFHFSNGTTSLSTDTTHWTVSESGFASANAVPVSLGVNSNSLQIWGGRSGISSTAEAIWPYYADWSQGHGGHAYFVAQITAVPEPTEALMFALGLAGLGAAVRRQRRR